MTTAKYTEGSITGHLLVMTASATTGLMALFLSELVDMYFLSLLGEIEIAAAIGYAGSLLFFSISLNIGLSIACSALVSQVIGSGDREKTIETIANSWTYAFFIALTITLFIWPFIPQLMTLIGAKGQAHALAVDYLRIVIPSMPLLAIAMSAGGVMRALGAAKGAMWLTLIGGIVNVLLDPFFIFTLGLGVKGAAIATVISRIAMVAYGFYMVAHRYQLLGRPTINKINDKLRNYLSIALPAVLTNLSTPIGVAYVTYSMAQFGTSAVAGNAIISRIQPVAFAGLFALSGIVGPIAGQNFGAKKLDRVRETLFAAIRLTVIYCVIVSVILALSQDYLVILFDASNEAESLVRLFCNGLSLMFIFNGMTFISNALFNNLGLAHYATFMNLAKATVGTIPFVYLGSHLASIDGVLWGLFLGSVTMGIIGLILAIKKI